MMEENDILLDIYSDVEEESTSEGWVIDSEKKAVWAIAKVKKLEEEADRKIKGYQMVIENAEAKIDFEKGKLDAETEHWKYLLVDWMMAQQVKETKTQYSLKLFNGTLKMTKPSIVLEHDDTAVLPWLKEAGHTDYIKTKESLDWAALKKVVSYDKETGMVMMDTGEIAEGITAANKEGSFSIKFE